MIFLRQKHYTNRHANNRNRTSTGNNNHRNIYNRQHRGYPAINNNNLFNPNNLHLIRSTYTNSYSSINNLNSVTFNERLASIGGLFGVLSIIITGALLYAIFTVKAEDKWYYIIAVLINVSLLIVLMLSAIIFDRFYLKKTTSSLNARGARVQQQACANPSMPNNRTIGHLNATTLYHAGQDLTTHQASHMGRDSRDQHAFRAYNDVPPSYPGYLDTHNEMPSTSSSSDATNPVRLGNPLKTNRKATAIYDISSHVGTNDASLLHQNASSRSNRPLVKVTLNDDNFFKNNLTNLDDKNNFSNSPPNYFDLYPFKENDSHLILNHNVTLTTTSNNSSNNPVSSLLNETEANNNNISLPSTSNSNSMNNNSNNKIIQIKSEPSSRDQQTQPSATS